MKAVHILVYAALMAGVAVPGKAQPDPGEALQVIAQWKANSITCQSPATSALAAIGACEQRDALSKRLAQLNYCYGPTDESNEAAWTPCGAEVSSGVPGTKARQDSTRARTIEHFQRMRGVFVLPATINGSSKAYFIVDSGAANTQIPEDVVEEMKRNGNLSDADFLGQRRFTLADGRGLQQRILRLRTIKIGERTMDNVLAAVGAPRTHALLGQSFLRRLSWWKIDNVKNAIEFEFTGSF